MKPITSKIRQGNGSSFRLVVPVLNKKSNMNFIKSEAPKLSLVDVKNSAFIEI